MKLSFLHLAIGVLILWGCGSGSNSATDGFTINETKQGFELSENGDPVFFYQRKPKSGDGEFYFNNYLHPLYNLTGDTLTEEFPEDHYHHRGIFWAWHQLFMEDQNLGDQWMMEGIRQDVSNIKTELDPDAAIINIMVTWHSDVPGKNVPFMDEQTNIIVHPRTENKRIIDFEISLTALVPGIKIGGSADEKGYGGFSARLSLPEDLVFTNDTGRISPQNLQLSAGPSMDFSGSLGGNPETNGVTIICHPQTPNYPASWILRQKNSMQNIVYPGQGLVPIDMENPTVLKYRMIIHNGRIVNP